MPVTTYLNGQSLNAPAIVITVGDRFFYSYKNDRVNTAWSLAGAKLFGPHQKKEIEKIEAILTRKRKSFKRREVSLAILSTSGGASQFTHKKN